MEQNYFTANIQQEHDLEHSSVSSNECNNELFDNEDLADLFQQCHTKFRSGVATQSAVEEDTGDYTGCKISSGAHSDAVTASEVKFGQETLSCSAEEDLLEQSTLTEKSFSGGSESESRIKCEIEECADVNYNRSGKTSSRYSAMECNERFTGMNQRCKESSPHFVAIDSSEQYDEENSQSIKHEQLSEQSDITSNASSDEMSDEEEFSDALPGRYPKSKSDVSAKPIIKEDRKTKMGVFGEPRRLHADELSNTNEKDGCPNSNVSLCGFDDIEQHTHDKFLISKQHHCSQCEKSFSTKRGLKQHVKKVHGDRRYNCDRCDFSSKYNQVVQFHISSVHLEDKPHECPQCHTCFTRKDVLTRHVKSVHNHEKHFACDQCGFRSSQKGNLVHHQKTVHDEVKRFSCSLCEYRTSKKSSLRQHYITVHHNEKSYSCIDCSKAFIRSTHLKAHINAVHMGLRPYSCIECDSQFSQKSNLVSHIKAKHRKVGSSLPA